ATATKPGGACSAHSASSASRGSRPRSNCTGACWSTTISPPAGSTRAGWRKTCWASACELRAISLSEIVGNADEERPCQLAAVVGAAQELRLPGMAQKADLHGDRRDLDVVQQVVVDVIADFPVGTRRDVAEFPLEVGGEAAGALVGPRPMEDLGAVPARAGDRIRVDADDDLGAAFPGDLDPPAVGGPPALAQAGTGHAAQVDVRIPGQVDLGSGGRQQPRQLEGNVQDHVLFQQAGW